MTRQVQCKFSKHLHTKKQYISRKRQSIVGSGYGHLVGWPDGRLDREPRSLLTIKRGVIVTVGIGD